MTAVVVQDGHGVHRRCAARVLERQGVQPGHRPRERACRLAVGKVRGLRVRAPSGARVRLLSWSRHGVDVDADADVDVDTAVAVAVAVGVDGTIVLLDPTGWYDMYSLVAD